MLTDCIDLTTQSKEMPNQQSNISYFVYNFPQNQIMDYPNNQLPQLQFKNSSDSIFKDNLQIPQFLQGLSVPSFQFNNSNQFYQNEPRPRYMQPITNTFATFFNEQQQTTKLRQESKKNRIIIGTQTLCDIEIVLIGRYFDIKTQLFCPPNIRYNLNEDKSISNAAWIKDRIKNRYKRPIKESVFDLINVLSNLEEQELRSLSGLLDFSTQGFDNLEKQVAKSVKQEKPFQDMMLEIQIILAQFLITKF